MITFYVYSDELTKVRGRSDRSIVIEVFFLLQGQQQVYQRNATNDVT